MYVSYYTKPILSHQFPIASITSSACFFTLSHIKQTTSVSSAQRHQNSRVKKSRRKMVSRLTTATNNVRTLLRDIHIQELDEELMETSLVWDAIGISEVKRPEECFTTLQSGHLLYQSKANNGQAGVGFLINRKWKYHNIESKQHQPQSSRTCSVHN